MLSTDKLKILLAAGSIFLFLTILILINLLKKDQIRPSSNLIPSFFRKNKEGAYPPSFSKKPSISPTNNEVEKGVSFPTLSLSPTPKISQKKMLSIKPINNKDFLSKYLLKIKNSLPIETEDFQASYSSQLDKIILSEKSDKAIDSFKLFLAKNGLDKNQTELVLKKFTAKLTSAEDLKKAKEIEEIIQNIKNSDLLTPQPTPTPYKFKDVKEYQREQENRAKKAFENTIRNVLQLLSTPSEYFQKKSSTISSPLPKGPNTPPSLKALINEVAKNTGVPSAIIEAVLRIENPAVFNLPDTLISEYSEPGNYWPECGPNVCSAAGPMQMTIGIDNSGSSLCSQCCWNGECLNTKGGCPNQWAIYGAAVNLLGGYTHTPNPCNIRDNIYAGALKLKTDSRAKDPLNWSREEVFRAAQAYYGNCTVKYARLGNRTYCEYVWDYYLNNR